MAQEPGSRPTPMDEIRRQEELLRPIDHAVISQPASDRDANDPNQDCGYSHTNGIGVMDGVSSSERGDIASKKMADAFHERTSLLSFRNTTLVVESAMRAGWNDGVTALSTYADTHGFENPSQTTVAVAQVFLEHGQRKVTTLHSGDTRIFALLEDGTLHPLTQDHSVVWQDVERGILTRAEAIEINRVLDTFKTPQDLAAYNGPHNIRNYVDDRDNGRHVITKNASSDGPLDPDENHPYSYTLKTQLLPKGTIALVAQSDYVHDSITPEDEARQLRGAGNAREAAQQVLSFVDTELENATIQKAQGNGFTRTKDDDGTVAVLQLEAFPPADESFLSRIDALPTRQKVRLAALATVAGAAITVWSLWPSSGDTPPQPVAKTEQPTTTPAVKPTATEVRAAKPTMTPEKFPQEIDDVYGREHIKITKFLAGKTRVKIGENGVNLRADATNDPDRVSGWIINPAEIREINGVAVNTEEGIDEFDITDLPITTDRVTGEANWGVIVVTANFSSVPGKIDMQRKDAYFKISSETENVVTPLDENGQPREDLSSLPIGELNTREGTRVNKAGRQIEVGRVRIVSR